jgi:hypothetical protein
MIYGATLSGVAAPPPIEEDDELAQLMLELPLDLYLRHADAEGEFLADSSGSGNRGAVVGALAAWGVDAELATPENPERAITYGGSGSVEVDLSALGVATYGVRGRPVQADIDNSVAIMGKNADGNNAGNWSLRLLSGGAVRVFFQTGTVQTTLESSSGLIEAGVWFHIYVVMSASGVWLYVNGDLVQTSAAHTIGETGTSLPLTIGASNYTSNFAGTIHEVIRSASALDATQVGDRSFGDAATPSGDTFVQLPTPEDTVTVSNLTALLAAVNVAPPGRHILVDPGNYGGFNTTFGGTAAAPVIIRPSDKNDPPIFTGTCNLYGTGGGMWGSIFRNHTGTALPGTRSIRVYGTDMWLAYNDIEAGGMALEIASTAPRRTRVERNRFHNQPSEPAGAGGEAIKSGVSGSLTVPHATLVQLNLIEDYVLERETISIKGEMIFRRNHLKGSRQIAFRHCRACTVEENRIETPFSDSDSGRIQVNGPDNIVRGNIGTLITVDRGTDGGDTVVTGSSAVYLAATRTTLQNNTMSNAIRVGDNPFSASLPEPVVNTNGSNDTPAYTLLNGATVGTAATVTSQTPPTLTSLTTGIIAYRNEVTLA